MNQRVAVRAIIKKDDKILLLKRSTGRPSILGKFELPGGRIEYDEQPEETLSRVILQDTGLKTQVSQLLQVITYTDHDDRDIQYTLILYLVSPTPTNDKIILSKNYSHYVWKKIYDIQQEIVTESSKILLNSIQQISYINDKNREHVDNNVEITTKKDEIIIYSDGGSRGNPGPSAAGFVVMNSMKEVIYTGGLYLGITTNNQAEYQAVRLGLEWALKAHAKKVDFRIDSLLVVNQMKGVYKIKNRELWPINERIRELVSQFEKVTFTHVRREFNQLADGMVNKILNETDS
jgi:ribonuclease HI